MNERLKLVWILALVVLFTGVSGCTKWQSDERLTLPKTPYLGNELRTDGFFYQKEGNGTRYAKITFFYNNGIVFQGHGAGDMSELIEYVHKTLSYHDIAKDKKGFWGLFLIENNKIVYERWQGSQLGYLVYREEGGIINDTTFIMTEVSRMNQGEKTETKQIERTYYFHQFSPKPDSTNIFIP